MEVAEILKIIRRRKDSLENSSSIADTSEVLVTRGDMTRLLADEYEDLLREIESSKDPGSLRERRLESRL
jgi:hypothetical protein